MAVLKLTRKCRFQQIVIKRQKLGENNDRKRWLAKKKQNVLDRKLSGAAAPQSTVLRAAAVCCLVWSNHRPSGCDVRGLQIVELALSGWPTRTARQSQRRAESKTESNTDSTATPCAQFAVSGDCTPSAAHAHAPPAATDLTPMAAITILQQQPCPAKGQPSGHDTTSVNIFTLVQNNTVMGQPARPNPVPLCA